MRILTHTVTVAEDGQTAKQLLRGLWHISGSLLSRLKFRDAITANGVPVPVNHILRTGDVLGADVSDLPGQHPHILPVDYPLAILYEDEDLLLLDKPAGIAIHPAALTEETVTIAGAVAHYLQSDSFHAVNRLDRGTTGVMAVAKTGFVHARCMTLLHTDAFQRTTAPCATACRPIRQATSTCPSAGRVTRCSSAAPTPPDRPPTPTMRCWIPPMAAPCCG